MKDEHASRLRSASLFIAHINSDRASIKIESHEGVENEGVTLGPVPT